MGGQQIMKPGAVDTRRPTSYGLVVRFYQLLAGPVPPLSGTAVPDRRSELRAPLDSPGNQRPKRRGALFPGPETGQAVLVAVSEDPADRPQATPAQVAGRPGARSSLGSGPDQSSPAEG